MTDKKVSDMSDWTKLTDLSKEKAQKSCGGVTLRNARLAPTINPNSKLGGFISVLINPTPKCRFFTQLSCVIVYLLSRAQMCAFFLGCGLWGAYPSILGFTVSGS